MNGDSIIMSCTLCDYKSNKTSNIKRHMIRKHDFQKGMDAAPNDILVAPNVILAAPNDILAAPNVILDNIDGNDDKTCNKCSKCSKVFSRKSAIIKHKEKCKGPINILQCEYCFKEFINRSNKCKHRKICKLNPISDTYDQHVQSITNNIDNSVTNNTNTNNTNNTNNTLNSNTLNNTVNNNYNIITYNPVHTELMPIVPKHIDKIKRMINNSNTQNPKILIKIIRQFIDYSLDLYQNRFVIKNNLRSSYSKVHCGNNNWKHFVDSTIMPQFTNSIVGSFQELIQGSCDMKKHKFMNDYIDEMYSHGQEQYNSEACKDYAKLLEELKLKIYDLTKDIGKPVVM